MAVNEILLVGRCAVEPEMKQGKSKAFAKWTIAVDRKYRGQQSRECDFFNVIAFGNTARYVVRYLGKGAMHCIVGNIQNRKYVDSSGFTRYGTSIIVERVDIFQFFKGSRTMNQIIEDFEVEGNEYNNSLWIGTDSTDYIVKSDDEDIPNV